jgi:UDP-N-acetylglucosamine 2-epimerase (non-hydrolysing)
MTRDVMCIVGARPNFMKIAPIIEAFRRYRDLRAPLVHTGQHYDREMRHVMFEQLGIPEPDVDLGVGSGTHAVQTAEIMRRFEPVLDQQRPDAVLLVGDVNSTIACALVAVKKNIPVIHVEAGLRSYDRGMPEEINRVLTDQISSLLFTTERSAHANLHREGIDPARIHFVGNVMIDSLRAHLPRAVLPEDVLPDAPLTRGFGLVTLHRPSNVDDPDTLRGLLTVLARISAELPLVFPVHPRTQNRINELGLAALIESPRIRLTRPLGYLEMLGVMSRARVVLTDSGGIQEETTALGVPCLTLRENTERPITAEQGTNTVVGTQPSVIWREFEQTLRTGGKAGCIPELWDGQAAPRIVAVIRDWLRLERFEVNQAVDAM